MRGQKNHTETHLREAECEGLRLTCLRITGFHDHGNHPMHIWSTSYRLFITDKTNCSAQICEPQISLLTFNGPCNKILMSQPPCRLKFKTLDYKRENCTYIELT
jgi:hypothetical protein